MLKSITPTIQKLLNRLALFSTKDLCYYAPKSYDDRRILPKISHLKPSETATIIATINTLTEHIPRPKISILKSIVTDETGSLIAIWFNQAYLKKVLKPGEKVVLKGKLEINTYTGEKEFSVITMDLLKT